MTTEHDPQTNGRTELHLQRHTFHLKSLKQIKNSVLREKLKRLTFSFKDTAR